MRFFTALALFTRRTARMIKLWYELNPLAAARWGIALLAGVAWAGGLQAGMHVNGWPFLPIWGLTFVVLSAISAAIVLAFRRHRKQTSLRIMAAAMRSKGKP